MFTDEFNSISNMSNYVNYIYEVCTRYDVISDITACSIGLPRNR